MEDQTEKNISIGKNQRMSLSKGRPSLPRERRSSSPKNLRMLLPTDRRTSLPSDKRSDKRFSLSSDRTSSSKDRRISAVKERQTSPSRERKLSIAIETRQSNIEDKKTGKKAFKPRHSILRSKTSLKKLEGPEKSISFLEFDVDRRKICVGLLMDIIKKSVTISEDDPKNVGKAIREELIERVLEESDIETIASRVVGDVINTVISKYSVGEDEVTSVLENTMPELLSVSQEDFDFGSRDFDTIEEEIRARLENMVYNAMKRSKTGIIEDVLNDIVDSVAGSSAEEKVLFSVTRFSTHPSEAPSEFEAVEEEEPDLSCVEFMGYDAVADNLVGKITNRTQEYLGNSYYNSPERKDSEETEEDSEEDSKSDESDEGPFVEVFEKKLKDEVTWPRIKDFDAELGKTCIYEFLETWYYNEDWLYCVNHVGCLSDKCSDFYYYQAIWSIPLPSYPIPQATASVFFTIESCRVIPPTCSVNVSYQFEGTRFVHKPGMIEFQEDWLFNIIDTKIGFFKTLNF